MCGSNAYTKAYVHFLEQCVEALLVAEPGVGYSL
jgi:hypothetical protein